MNLEERVAHLVQRSEFTVRNGHAWTGTDHQILLDTLNDLIQLRASTGVDRPRASSRRALYSKRRRRGC